MCLPCSLSMCYLVSREGMSLPALVVDSWEVLTDLNAVVETGAASVLQNEGFCSLA